MVSDGDPETATVNDRDFLHHVLSDHAWHGWHDIMRRSQQERGHGLTIHSRAADLRRRGHVIDCRSERLSGRHVSFYRLVPLDEIARQAQPNPPAPTSPGLAVSSSGSASNPAPSSSWGADDADAPGGRDGDDPLVPGQLVLEVAA